MKLKYVIIVYVVLSLVMIIAYISSPKQWRGSINTVMNWVEITDNLGLIEVYDYEVNDGVWGLGDYTWTKCDVNSYGVSDELVFGETRDGKWYISYKERTRFFEFDSELKDILLFDTEGEFKEKLAEFGIEEFNLLDPEQVKLTRTDQELHPWYYDTMRGLFGFSDPGWGLLFTAIAIVISYLGGRHIKSGDGTESILLISYVYLGVIFGVFWVNYFDPSGGAFLFLGISVLLCYMSYKMGLKGKNKREKKVLGDATAAD